MDSRSLARCPGSSTSSLFAVPLMFFLVRSIPRFGTVEHLISLRLGSSDQPATFFDLLGHPHLTGTDPHFHPLHTKLSYVRSQLRALVLNGPINPSYPGFFRSLHPGPTHTDQLIPRPSRPLYFIPASKLTIGSAFFIYLFFSGTFIRLQHPIIHLPKLIILLVPAFLFFPTAPQSIAAYRDTLKNPSTATIHTGSFLPPWSKMSPDHPVRFDSWPRMQEYRWDSWIPSTPWPLKSKDAGGRSHPEIHPGSCK